MMCYGFDSTHLPIALLCVGAMYVVCMQGSFSRPMFICSLGMKMGKKMNQLKSDKGLYIVRMEVVSY